MNKETMLIQIIGDCIKEAGEEGIPSGHLFAMLNAKGLRIDTYTSIIDAFVKNKLVKDENYLLVWTGK